MLKEASCGLLVREDGEIFLPDGVPKTQYFIHKYLHVKYKQIPYRVHRLVAEAFLPERPSIEHEIDHLDGNPINNRADNLEWVTHSENVYRAMRSGNHPNPEVPVVGFNGSESITFISQSEAARRLGIQQPNISKCLHGERNTAGGLSWRYA